MRITNSEVFYAQSELGLHCMLKILNVYHIFFGYTFRYFKVLVQEFNVKIDKGFMMSLYDVFAHLMAAEESEVIRGY